MTVICNKYNTVLVALCIGDSPAFFGFIAANLNFIFRQNAKWNSMEFATCDVLNIKDIQ